MNIEKIKFKKETLAALTIKPEPYYIKDADTPYLRLRIYPSGIKTFLVCRKVKRKPQRIKIGRFGNLTIDQARQEAKRINSLIDLGHNPHVQKRIDTNEITFKDVFQIYYKEHALPHTKDPELNRKALEYHVFPKFGNKRLSEITPENLRKFHTELRNGRAGSTANRVINMMSAVFNFAIKTPHYKGINPCTAVKRFRVKSRDRFLHPHELDLFFKAASEEETLFEDFFLMLLFTGARKANVLSMKWTGIEFLFKRWRISDDETKNKEINLVMLPDQTMAILERRFRENQKLAPPSEYVFPGTGACGHLHDPKKAFKRIKKRMGVSDFTMHDLRRTLGSYMAISGASLPIIGAALNHKSYDSTEIYARLSKEPVLEAVNKAVNVIRGGNVDALFKQNLILTERQMSAVHFSQLSA